MKIRSILIIASAMLGVSQIGYAQCPEICDNDNTALGQSALLASTGAKNTAVGFQALQNNNGDSNTATGYQALLGNSGFFNTAFGTQALVNGRGTFNTAVGAFTLVNNTSNYNTALGYQALSHSTTGGTNTAVGYNALTAATDGYNNTAVGNYAGGSITTGSNNLDIGNSGASGDSNRIRIGTKGTHLTTFMAGITGVTIANGVGVVINNQGQLGTLTSSACYKEAIKPMDKTSEAILSLQPVTFRYKHDFDPDGIPQFGLVAEQVEKVNPDLVAHDEEGKPYTVRYEAVNAMLLNEFLKEHKRVQEQEAALADVKSTAAKQATTIEQQEKEIQALTEALKAQAVQIQKVSDQLGASKPAQRLVADSH